MYVVNVNDNNDKSSRYNDNDEDNYSSDNDDYNDNVHFNELILPN